MQCTPFAALLGSMVFRYQYATVEGGMRKRSRRTPNTSESTGKIGQELPSNQPRPLVPLYPGDDPAPVEQLRTERPEQKRPAETRHPDSPLAGLRPARPERRPRPEAAARQEWDEAAGTARFTLDRSIRFYWRWAAILAILAISSAVYMGFRS